MSLWRDQPTSALHQAADNADIGANCLAVAVAPTSLQLNGMPLTVFDIKGVPGHRRERIEVAVVAGGKHAEGPHEAWISADPFKSGFRVLITGRTALSAL